MPSLEAVVSIATRSMSISHCVMKLGTIDRGSVCLRWIMLAPEQAFVGQIVSPLLLIVGQQLEARRVPIFRPCASSAEVSPRTGPLQVTMKQRVDRAMFSTQHTKAKLPTRGVAVSSARRPTRHQSAAIDVTTQYQLCEHREGDRIIAFRRIHRRNSSAADAEPQI